MKTITIKDKRNKPVGPSFTFIAASSFTSASVALAVATDYAAAFAFAVAAFAVVAVALAVAAAKNNSKKTKANVCIDREKQMKKMPYINDGVRDLTIVLLVISACFVAGKVFGVFIMMMVVIIALFVCGFFVLQIFFPTIKNDND